jgi:hypothetical protein
VDDESISGDERAMWWITLCIQKYPLTCRNDPCTLSFVPASARQPEPEERPRASGETSNGIAASEGPTGFTRWKRSWWGVIRLVDEIGIRATGGRGSWLSATANQATGATPVGRLGELTGRPGNEAIQSAQPTRATGLDVPSKRDHPPERKL